MEDVLEQLSLQFTTARLDILKVVTFISLVLLGTWMASWALNWIIRRTKSGNHGRNQGLFGKQGPILRLLIWSLGLVLIITALFDAPALVILIISLPAAFGIGLASRDLIRNLIAGVILSVDREFEEGNVLRIGEHEGEVVSIGLRNIKLKAFDGHVIEIPNAQFLNETSSNITPETNDAQIKIVMALPPGVRLERARKVAYTAAVVSRYASLKVPAEVFVDTDGTDDLMTRLTIRGYVLDPIFEEHYRSDVIALTRRGLGHGKISIAPGDLSKEFIPEDLPPTRPAAPTILPPPVSKRNSD